MKKQILPVTLTFTTPLLATAPGEKEKLREYIASKAPNQTLAEQEVNSIEEQLEKGSTVFYRNEKHEVLVYDYQVRGLLKALTMIHILLNEPDFTGLNPWNYKQAIDLFVHVSPRQIMCLDSAGRTIVGSIVVQDEKGEKVNASIMPVLERPLRADTMQGPRVALARSEMIPPGSKIQFIVTCILPDEIKRKRDGGASKTTACITADMVKRMLDFGGYNGLGQWRGGGYGAFTAACEPVK